MKRILKNIPGKELFFDAAIAASEHSKPRYLEDSISLLEAISPRPEKKNSRPSPIVVEAGIDLSFIVPVYNVEAYVAECVESILSQKTEYSFEVVLVNDGSTDSSREVALSAARGDSRLRIVDQTNAGVAAARNKGLDVCRGLAVTFVDPDDFLKQGFAQAYMDSLVTSRVDYIVGGYSDVDEHGHIFDSCYTRNRMGTPWGRIFKREVWKDVRFPEGFLFEDTVLPYLVEPRCSSRVVKNDFYCYRHRDNSLSRSGKTSRVIDTFWVVEHLLQQCESLGIPFDAVAKEFLTNACFTVYGRRLQLDGEWLLPLFSAFSDTWMSKQKFVSTDALPDDLKRVARTLSMKKYDQWRLLGWKEVLRGL